MQRKAKANYLSPSFILKTQQGVISISQLCLSAPDQTGQLDWSRSGSRLLTRGPSSWAHLLKGLKPLHDQSNLGKDQIKKTFLRSFPRRVIQHCSFGCLNGQQRSLGVFLPMESAAHCLVATSGSETSPGVEYVLAPECSFQEHSFLICCWNDPAWPI